MSPSRDEELETLVHAIPEGWTRLHLAGQPWAITRTTRAEGKVITIDAERLGGAEYLGANVWLTSHGALLKPCEVPTESVLRVLRAAADALSPG
jgi:peptide-methionine (S)-S-oxide reductase